MKCTKCSLENRHEAKYCLECGEKLFVQCDNCGISLPLSAKFCDNCGERVDTMKIDDGDARKGQGIIHKTLKEAKESFEKDYLLQILQLAKGNITKAAEMSGKYRSDFYDLLRKHNLKPDGFKPL